MKIHIAVSLVGTFSLSEDGTVINVRYFKLDPQAVSKKLVGLEKGSFPAELEEMVEAHKKDELVVVNSTLAKSLASKGFSVVHQPADKLIARFLKNIAEYSVTSGIFASEKEYLQYLRLTVLLITREKVRLAAEKRDRLIVHAIETIDDLDKSLNLFAGRLREFYGMHFPELADAIDNHYTFAMVVSKSGSKENITQKMLTDDLNLPKEKAKKLLASRKKSMGSPLLEQDIEIIVQQAKTIVSMFEQRHSLEKWMEQAMKTVAPNISGIVSPLLGARLIALAGGLRPLAMSPSSKIQILGAEKALYRTIKTGAPPPKHGIIFQDPRLNQAKWWLRGKIARVLAGRLSIASRMDFFEAEDQSASLEKEINDKITAITKRYPTPPTRSKRRSKPSQRKHSKSSRKRTHPPRKNTKGRTSSKKRR